MKEEEFEPKIIVFACNWCSYAGIDLAGTSRIRYPHNIRVVRTMCSSRVTPEMILDALRSGADGVLITGCHPGDCHYISGNYLTLRKYYLLKKFLKEMGLENRVALAWISASEGEKWARIAKEFTEYIKKLGPLKIKEV
ncbi:MAG: methyl-viologen-reducing hydrogenase subunit delta [Thermoprotei archaeon]|nr:MAG: methyl-viologen-reducing hydrogenase subunit delta [Thermoprotei archaeon]